MLSQQFNILITMLFLIFVSVVICASAQDTLKPNVFHKCCTRYQSLIKVTDEDSQVSYQCVNPEDAANKYNLSISPLIIGKNVPVEYGIPTECDEVQMVRISSPELDVRFKSLNTCYDRLVADVVNDTLKLHIPQVVTLNCIKNDTENSSKDRVKVNHFRKCCPNGQSYDTTFHLCRKTDTNNTEEWLMSRLGIGDDGIYEIDNELNCKVVEHGVELREQFYTLIVDGSDLRALSMDGYDGGEVSSGQWCVDREYNGAEMVARVCTRNCSQYGAYCVRKCCPIGYHYRARKCGGSASSCVPNKDEVLFNITEYLEPIQRKNEHVTDVLGVATDLLCSNGKAMLNKSAARDRHYLDMEGRLFSPIIYEYTLGYCFETFDSRHCPDGDLHITAVSCFVKANQPPKDYDVSFILILISSVCLALTLVVYISLPELRNLHGRTLICHTSMMLLAFGCLARVQHGLVVNARACTLLGYGIYFGFVAAFAWLNVMCFDIWWTFGSVRTVQPMRKTGAEMRRFLWYSLYAWGTTVLLTLSMFLFDKYPVADALDANMGDGICWFGSLQNTRLDWPHYIYFVVPMGLVTCTNFVLWVLTARHCARVKSEVHRLQAGSIGDRAKRRFRVDRAKYVLTGKLWVVMGAGWISELLSTIVTEPHWLWNIIDVINSLQGVFIFLILVIKPKLYYLLRKRLGLEKPGAQKNGASSSARTSSTFLSRAISTDERNNTRLSIQNNLKQS